ncbi:hypothetical protein EJ04DRAFT_258309 [Polyplosphaeria fusca]|uniref:Rhodopsin domain-containing protein n=1 Tax=Polyplosphaeria fusca TaxID=682080 RepID=A0A9P4UZ58_9PLEO|nr:hypothetical protein EJ04DRAFT_258309 [Polyplosphaeria fusca]
MPPVVTGLPETGLARTDLQPENATRIILFMVVFSLLALVAVALRVASKCIQWARPALDDALLVAAAAQMLVMNIMFVVAIKRGGLGQHVSSVTTEQLAFFMKMYFAAGLVMPTCYALAKLSILWLLYTIFTFRNFRKVLRLLAIVVVCWWLTAILLDTFICYPIHFRWDFHAKGSCSNKVIQVEFFATPIPWIITDFAILIAPLPSLWTMKTSRARQIGLGALFGFGIATCAVACKRYVTLLSIDDDDITFSMVEPAIWTMIESSTTIICAALPASTLALKRILPTGHLTRMIEFVEDQFYAWKESSGGRMSGKDAVKTVQEPVEPPAACLSTNKLDLTPI